MSISSSISAAPAVKLAAAAVNNFQHRLMICLVHTLLNAIIIVRFFPVLYKATANEAFQQIGVSLLFAVMLGSLGRMWFLALMNRNR
ncbi:MAG: hypothetical protein ABSB50_09670 [Terracidiphilus sp.]|jgi:hypothetical protein